MIIHLPLSTPMTAKKTKKTIKPQPPAAPTPKKPTPAPEPSAVEQQLLEAQRLLEESRDRYADLYDFAPVVYVTLDNKGLIQEINLTGAAMLKMDRSHLIGMPFNAFVLKEDLQKFLQHLRQGKQSAQPVTSELNLIIKGEHYQVEMVSIRIYDLRQKAPLYRTAISNVSLLRKAQEALQQERDLLELRVKERTAQLHASEERYRQIVETAEEGIASIDAGLRITFVNRKFADMLGYTEKELLGRAAFDFIAEEDYPLAETYLENIHRGVREQYEFMLKKKDGSPLWCLIAVAPSISPGGEFAGATAMFTDITLRKEMEAELQASEQQCRVMYRQVLVSEDKERQRVSRELHDTIGQTLSAVKFRLETYLHHQLEAPVETQREALLNAVSLIQNAVEEVRRICMDLRPATLDDIGVLATISWFSREFEGVYPHIKVEQEFAVTEKEIPHPLRTVIYRVFQEAFNNAAKHSGAARIKVALYKNKKALELAIEDDGHGFEVEAVLASDSVFKGLGLPGMRERVELSGGDFIIESAPGKGTVVKASWPLKLIKDGG